MSKLAGYVDKVKQEAEDSDLTNLAHAILQIDTELEYLKDLRLRVHACAELPKEKRPVDMVRALYDEAHGRNKRPRP